MARTTTTGQYMATDDNTIRTLDISYKAKSFYLSCSFQLSGGRSCGPYGGCGSDGWFRPMDGSRRDESNGPTQAMVVGPP
ncbi:unnamed protein product [Heligmosomoides polygyrus]|uniref:ZP domain-containing protein n=1 Tax=Heligmosomoides polygyrus TaxID=6339 RepID=A0A183FC88_HELPZ|nr:unnamed protein product [Heligmosomoides polygyrus]